jgi:uncharacterized protein YwgA
MAAQRVFRIIMIWQIKAYLESVAAVLDFEEIKVRVNTISNHQRLQRQVKLLKALSFCIC